MVVTFTIYSWELTDLYLAATGKGLCKVGFSRNQSVDDFLRSVSTKHAIRFQKDKKHFASLEAKLDKYFLGKEITFDIPLDLLDGTNFQKQVWESVRGIKYGHTASYKQIAKKVGDIKAVRAVGMANSVNPVPIIIPCHRVISSNGKLGGYSGGLDVKDALLRLEGAVF